MERWYIAKVKARKENGVKSFLSQWGVEVFQPRVVQTGHAGAVLTPLFPTYLFVYLDPESSIWPLVRWAPGMRYFLYHDSELACVPQTLIDYLHQRVNHWNERRGSHYLRHGDKVIVIDGPIAGLEGIFQRNVPSRERCRILLELMGRLTSVELPEYDVRAANWVYEGEGLEVTLAD